MRFRSRNTKLLTIGLAAVLCASGCQPESERRLTQSTRRELELGRASAQAWQDSARSAEVSEASSIAVGYLERLRLGLGSPFRLIDFALADPRLDELTRHRLGYALLARALDGNSYEIDPVALDRAGAAGVQAWPGLGARHLSLIQKTIRESDRPLAAEAGVRMGYAIAAAEGVVSSEAPKLAGQVGALLVDRELATTDAKRLLATTNPTESPVSLVPYWREQRAFEVEEPRLGPLTFADELASIEIARNLVHELRDLGLKSVSHARPAVVEPRHTPLTAFAAKRLDRAENQLDAPPQTPIVLAARQLARESAVMPWLSDAQRLARTRFGNRALNEESFVVQHAALLPESPHDGARARVALLAAVALRAYSQESVWYPGMDGPTSRDLQERYGLAAITFDRTVPSAWRPYYRRMLAQSIGDLVRVLPALDVRGLRVHFGAAPTNPEALAVHYPGTRRLVLPPLTSAGTIAHEIAHDVDYQTALRRYHVRGDYATDRAARSSNDALAVQLRSLEPAYLRNTIAAARPSEHARRPAEIFARHVDWYVAVSLARLGRRNGYLSSVQDELITGYGTVRPPDVAGAAGDALMTILSELAPVYREQRDGFKALYGSARLPRAYDLVRRIVEPTVIPGSMLSAELDQLRLARDSAIAAIDATGCGTGFTAPFELLQARRELVLLATQSRARGLAHRKREAGASVSTPLAPEVTELGSIPAAVRRSPFELQLADACVTAARVAIR